MLTRNDPKARLILLRHRLALRAGYDPSEPSPRRLEMSALATLQFAIQRHRAGYVWPLYKVASDRLRGARTWRRINVGRLP
jgi:hypothetical protein